MNSAIRSLIFVAAIAALVVSKPATSCAQFEVAPGFDLWTTDPAGTHFFFDQTPFQGVPLGTFDFGGTIGVQDVGTTDTIVQRLQPASGVPGVPANINIELVSLQLRSVDPIDLGAGLDFHYLTLSNGPPVLGAATISFDSANGGTYNPTFAIPFGIEYHIGAIDGPVVSADVLQLLPSAVEPTPSWVREPLQPALQIEGVNLHLGAGMTTDADIWTESGGLALLPIAQMSGPGQLSLVTTVPEPSTAVLATLAVLGLLGFGRRRRRQ